MSPKKPPPSPGDKGKDPQKLIQKMVLNINFATGGTGGTGGTGSTGGFAPTFTNVSFNLDTNKELEDEKELDFRSGSKKNQQTNNVSNPNPSKDID